MSAAPVSRLRSLWGPYWVLPLVPAIHAAAMAAVGQFRPEHLVAALAIAGLAFASRATQQMVAAALPAVAVALAYDVMRFLTPLFVRPERVWGCEMRALELKLFGLGPDTTIPDFFQAHNTPAFDLLFALPYGLFIYVVAAYGLYLFVADRERLHHYLWAFALAHVLAFTIWMLVPAAPPWYIRAHGCVIDTSVAPNAAALLRVDRLLGITYFESFYSRGPNSFGAMPSLHCAFPMIGIATAWRKATWRTWPLHIGYAGLMVVASMYLDHHWLIDGLVGWAVAIAGAALAGWLLRLRRLPPAAGADGGLCAVNPCSRAAEPRHRPRPGSPPR